MLKRLVLAAWLLLTPSALAAPTAEDLAKLKAGETITRPYAVEGMAGVEALFWVEASPETAYRILSDTARLAEFMPSLSECAILQSGDGFAVVRMISEQGEMLQRRSYDPPYRVSWKLVQPASLVKDVRGRWLIEPSGKGTILSYGVAILPAFPVPHALLQQLQNSKLPPLIRNVRARIESGGTWTKPDFKKR